MNYELIKKNYERGLWSKAMVKMAVRKGVITKEQYKEAMEYLGTFQQQYANGGFRGWPTIVPIRYGNYERYLWITFDRGAQTGRYSYGTLYFYLGDKMWKIE